MLCQIINNTNIIPNTKIYKILKQPYMSKLSITDLLSSLQPQSQAHTQTPSQPQVPKFMDKLLKQTPKKIKVLSKKQQQMMRRQSNYEMAKQEMDKWVGIIKVNREKESLNFQQKDIGNLNVNFFSAEPINEFHKKLENKLESMNVHNQKSVLKHQESVLEKVDPEQAKRRLIEARKHRTAVFYEQQKRRRISKIKSKLYHKIKKHQKQRQQMQNLQKMSPAQKNSYIEKLTKQRIKQRITLRHNTKNKHIQNLLRFNRNQKNSIQNSINQVNQIRNKQMERLEDDMREVSEEYDEENFREQAMKDLQEEIERIERQNNDEEEVMDQVDQKLKDLRFIKNAKEKRLQKEKHDAIKIFNKLAKGKQLKQKDVNSDMESEDVEQQQEQSSQSQGEPANRKKYGQGLQEEHETNQPTRSVQQKLRSYLLSGTQQNAEQKRQKNQQLIKDINLNNLKSKYQGDRVSLDLTSLIEQNQQIYGGNLNEAALQNVREFQADKFRQIEEEVQKMAEKNKKVKGWGNWAGPGITQKKVDPQQQLRNKLKKIQQIKNKRKDNSLAHVTITQVRNKNLSDYMVRELPHGFNNADQFDFMQSEPIGPQWNSLTQFNDNIKPKVIAKAGQVITPIKLPKSMQSKKKI